MDITQRHMWKSARKTLTNNKSFRRKHINYPHPFPIASATQMKRISQHSMKSIHLPFDYHLLASFIFCVSRRVLAFFGGTFLCRFIAAELWAKVEFDLRKRPSLDENSIDLGISIFGGESDRGFSGAQIYVGSVMYLFIYTFRFHWNPFRRSFVAHAISNLPGALSIWRVGGSGVVRGAANDSRVSSGIRMMSEVLPLTSMDEWQSMLHASRCLTSDYSEFEFWEDSFFDRFDTSPPLGMQGFGLSHVYDELLTRENEHWGTADEDKAVGGFDDNARPGVYML